MNAIWKPVSGIWYSMKSNCKATNLTTDAKNIPKLSVTG